MWKIERWSEERGYWIIVLENVSQETIMKTIKLYEGSDIKIRIVNF